MNDRPFILITGDDSVRGEGIILVKRIVEKFADCKIIATKKQRSGSASSIEFPGGEWGTEIVDGSEAVWITGTPADSVYFAFDYLDRKPDLVISGLNYGENLTITTHTSGTVGAALIAAQRRATPAISFSMRTKGEEWFKTHSGSFNETLLEYPGKLIEKIVKVALKSTMPEESFWNVNFPAKPTETLKVVPASRTDYWLNTQSIKKGEYKYKYDTNNNAPKKNTDLYEIDNGNATLTPFKLEFTDNEELKNLLEQDLFT